MGYIQYKIHPDDPEATAAERSDAYVQFFLGIIPILGTLCAVPNFFIRTVDMLKTRQCKDFLIAAGIVIVMSVIDFFFFYRGYSRKKLLAKRYFLFFFGGLFCSVGAVGAVMAVYFLCHGGAGVLLLILSVVGTAVTAAIVWCIHRKIKGVQSQKIRLFTDESVKMEAVSSITPPSETTAVVFCHKCGRKTLEDSAFCPSCGMRLQ